MPLKKVSSSSGAVQTDNSVHHKVLAARPPVHVRHDVAKSNVPLYRHRCDGYYIPVLDERGHALP